MNKLSYFLILFSFFLLALSEKASFAWQCVGPADNNCLQCHAAAGGGTSGGNLYPNGYLHQNPSGHKALFDTHQCLTCHCGTSPCTPDSLPVNTQCCTSCHNKCLKVTEHTSNLRYDCLSCHNSFDPDGDGVGDVCDNCPNTPNPNQEDNYPPQTNGCGDACDCEADIEPPNGDGDVDGSDAFLFKQKFFKPECATTPPYCPGDFDCDKDVDGSDAFMFKQDFFKPNCPTYCNPRGSANWCED